MINHFIKNNVRYYGDTQIQYCIYFTPKELICNIYYFYIKYINYKYY